MKIVQVESAFTRKAFLKVPRLIYRDDPYWISHIDQEIEAVFDPRRNRTFRNGEAARWILVDDAGDPIGRVAAFVAGGSLRRLEPGPVVRSADGGDGFLRVRR